MKNDCVMLAAGLSSRMGSWKPAVDVDGIPMIRRSISNAVVSTNRIILVGGYNFHALKQLAGDFSQVLLVENPDYARGMLTSVKAALNYIETESFFIALGDMPYINNETYTLMSQFPFKDALFPVFEGKRGHPVLVRSSIFQAIRRTPDHLMMREVLRDCLVSEINVDDPGIHKDVDKLSDIERNREKS
ncbi:MAG: nucleotidyltransferase family protein [Spirochaetales bacterium]|nr:nucleotidyltransferase family protein [Spirochaetales bacterium]